MKTVFSNESEFEEALIAYLHDKCGWQGNVLRYPTEQELIQNWADILFENNRERSRLNDAPLTRGEMLGIMEQIKTLRTPVLLNEFINGKTIMITRDNPDDPEHFGRQVSLKIYDRLEIAAGQSRYQIAQQPRFAAHNSMLPDRRGDLMLLINGMPVIHIELKKSNVPVGEAIEQIKKYAHENIFTGLFSLVQVFVVMNPDESRYFANPGPDGFFNPDYQFHWADFNNEPINEWRAVAEQLLSIPAAHELIGFYTVADSASNVLKVMRSYQIYAAKKISDRVARRKWKEKDQRGGYIWHTTGSGKTLTSFKAAHLIAESGDADKVVFLMDRIELGTQSLDEYRGFADDSTSVQATEDTNVLLMKLKSDDTANTLIVTSIQKMSRIREEGSFKSRDIEKIGGKRLVFIVDECHRDVFGQMMHDIKETFPNAMFFGCTGTPIQGEATGKKGETSDVFGNELHRYAIGDGIRDKNVLGFDPTMVLTFKDKDIRKGVALRQACANTEEEAVADETKSKIFYHFMRNVPMAGYKGGDGKYVRGVEDYLPDVQYKDENKHHRKVVEDILDNWIVISHGGKFHGLLATSSIQEAIDYYALLKDTKLKVAALFDPSIDNKDGAIIKEDAIVEMLNDYNNRYNQDFKLPTYAQYKKDISMRLSHKDPYQALERHPEQCLDLLIVVDQMLTGFDSKWLNVLYLDKVLDYERLIQAFSRTNRLAGPEKPYGMVRYYRYPHTMSVNIENAFREFSGDRPYGLFAEKLPHNLQKMNDLFEEIRQIFASADKPDFDSLPEDRTAIAKFAKAFRDFNHYLQIANVQGFSWEKQEYTFERDGEAPLVIHVACSKYEYDALLKRYQEIPRIGPGPGQEDVPIDIDPYLIEIDKDIIDSDYMNSRFKKFMVNLESGEATEEVLAELHRSFAVLSQEDQRYANMLLLDILSGKIKVSEDKSFLDYVADYRAAARDDNIHRFSLALGINEDELRRFMARHVTADTIYDYGYFDKLQETVDRNVALHYFERVDGKKMKLREVGARIRSALYDFILQDGLHEVQGLESVDENQVTEKA